MLKLLEINTYMVEYLPLGNTSNRDFNFYNHWLCNRKKERIELSLQTLRVCSCLENVHIYYVITESDVHVYMYIIYMYIAETDAIGSDSLNVLEHSLK